jgi:hypothetical protein
MSDELTVVPPAPAEKKGIEYPGKINYSGEIRGHYSGCKMIAFSCAEDMNTFFENTQHVIVVQIVPTATSINVLYTTALTPEELDDLGAWGRDMREFMASREAARQADRDAAQKIKDDAAAEEKRLAALGRQCEVNHPKAPKTVTIDVKPKKKGK